jgi:hypothetical protein
MSRKAKSLADQLRGKNRMQIVNGLLRLLPDEAARRAYKHECFNVSQPKEWVTNNDYNWICHTTEKHAELNGLDLRDGDLTFAADKLIWYELPVEGGANDSNPAPASFSVRGDSSQLGDS